MFYENEEDIDDEIYHYMLEGEYVEDRENLAKARACQEWPFAILPVR